METTQLEPLDVEDLLRQELTSGECPVAAPPIPESLGDTLPLAVVQRDGGTRVNPFVDAHDVTFFVWASTVAEATACANTLAGKVASLPHTSSELVQWRDATLTSLPYIARDSQHPNLSRVQFTASVICRTTI